MDVIWIILATFLYILNYLQIRPLIKVESRNSPHVHGQLISNKDVCLLIQGKDSPFPW